MTTKRCDELLKQMRGKVGEMIMDVEEDEITADDLVEAGLKIQHYAIFVEERQKTRKTMPVPSLKEGIEEDPRITVSTSEELEDVELYLERTIGQGLERVVDPNLNEIGTTEETTDEEKIKIVTPLTPQTSAETSEERTQVPFQKPVMSRMNSMNEQTIEERFSQMATLMETNQRITERTERRLDEMMRLMSNQSGWGTLAIGGACTSDKGRQIEEAVERGHVEVRET